MDDPSASGADPTLPTQFAAALAALTQLQQLTATAESRPITMVPAASLCHLPASLTHLCIATNHSGEVAAAGDHTDISLGHLTRLQKLNLTAPNGTSAQSQLPACLTCLTLVGPAQAVMGVPRLQCLLLCQTREALPFLQQVAQQARLQRLDLALHACSRQQLQQVFDALSSCTRLTRLHLFNSSVNPHAGHISELDQVFSVDLSGLKVHEQLSKLRQLQRLKLTQIKWDLEGSSQLTVLSALTQLKLHMCDIADLGLAVILQRLTSLRKLDVEESLPANDMLLVSVGALSNLQDLSLSWNDLRVTSDTLPLLSPLTKLTKLTLDKDGRAHGPAVSAAVGDAFVAGMPHLAEIEWMY